MTDFFSLPANEVPKLLAGARIYIAPHAGAPRSLPTQLKAWLKAMGAVVVADMVASRQKPATHVLHQSERQGYDNYHTARRCQERLREVHGPNVSIIDEPRLSPPAAKERPEVVLCDSDTFLTAAQAAVRAHRANEVGKRRLDALFEQLPEHPHYVGI